MAELLRRYPLAVIVSVLLHVGIGAMSFIVLGQTPEEEG